MQTFEIIHGVRRAKAASILRHLEIWALVEGTNSERRIPVESLLSPKSQIDTREKAGIRWRNVFEGMSDEPDLFEPIKVREGQSGIPIRNVEITGE